MDNNGKNISIGGDVKGSNNINTGDNAVQINTTQQGVAEQAFLELFRDIEEKCNVHTSEQMKFFAERLQEAYNQQDKTEGERLIGFLKGTLGNIGSLASIASLFGIAF